MTLTKALEWFAEKHNTGLYYQTWCIDDAINFAHDTTRETARRCAEIAFDADTNYDAKAAIEKEFGL